MFCPAGAARSFETADATSSCDSALGAFVAEFGTDPCLCATILQLLNTITEHADFGLIHRSGV